VTRREFSLAPLVAAAPTTTPAYWAINSERIERFDDSIKRALANQTMDEKSPWFGGLPDTDGLHHGGATAGLVVMYTTALCQPKSSFYNSPLVMQRLRAAVEFLNRHTSADGNLDLLITNFNSPPDTAFAMYSLCPAVQLARQATMREIEQLLEPVVKRCAGGLLKGGVHTPNHRWVVCAGLAQAHALYPNPDYVRRIDQWLAEGIDIDSDGQYTERSTAGYNGVTNRALVTTAIKLKRWELLEPVRRNLDAMQYLLHPGMEVVTDISTRQDLYTRGTMAGYWFAARFLAVRDGNGLYETYARQGAPGLWELMEYPELQQAGPEPAPPPENYEKLMPELKVARVRRGRSSSTIRWEGTSRFLAMRSGEAVLEAVRISSAFFGKGQFIPTRGSRVDEGFRMTQQLHGPYYQPLARVVPAGAEAWAASRKERAQSEVSTLDYNLLLTETEEGWRLRLGAAGTRYVPLVVELTFRAGGRLEGVEPVPGLTDVYLLKSGVGVYRYQRDEIHFGPGKAEHRYVTVRGAEPRLSGPTVYLTMYTPVDAAVEFRLK
jgi:hypothetical protein